MIKFSKNKDIKHKIDFLDQSLSQLLSFEDASAISCHACDGNIFGDIVARLPGNMIIDGKKLHQIIDLANQGVDREVERVKELKRKYEQNDFDKILSVQVDEIKEKLKKEYPCVRLQQVYADAVLETCPDFNIETLTKQNISFFEFVNVCRYFNSYNMPSHILDQDIY
jgi:hypothetical protein